jgi:ferritin-like protein
VGSRLMRHLAWERPPKSTSLKSGAPTALITGKSASSATETLKIDASLTPRDTAIYLLHIGAEIEQMLMVQYLYAGYSVGGPHLTPEQNQIAANWRQNILKVAREEMAHLATVQNLLTLIGGPVTFDREDFPNASGMYPFPFTLEPLTKRSVGRYVLAEVPGDDVLDKLGLLKEVQAIEAYVDSDGLRDKVHRVGILYSKVKEYFLFPKLQEDPTAPHPPFIPSSDIRAESIRFQVRPEEWGLGQADLLILSAADRKAAADAIQKISDQGEGSGIDDLPSSHFGRFLDIYRNFPEDWSPAKPVAKNPKLCADDEGDLITNEVARIWADLFNLRYRLLLMLLTHSFHIESTVEGDPKSPRGLLISWAFGEMYHLRSISEILMSLPLGDEAKEICAGPPFLMPYSLALPVHENNRWRGHRDLLTASNQSIATLLEKATPETHAYLNAFAAANDRALLQIAPLIGD